MSSKSKKPTKEQIELDEYLSKLTDIGLESESKAIFHLTETVRDEVLFREERQVLESFIEWATLESSKFIKPVVIEETEEEIAPTQVELFPGEKPSDEKLMELKRVVTRRGVGKICNDLLPEEKALLTESEWVWLCKIYHDWNGDPEEFDPKHCYMFDFMVIGYLDFYFFGGK